MAALAIFFVFVPFGLRANVALLIIEVFSGFWASVALVVVEISSKSRASMAPIIIEVSSFFGANVALSVIEVFGLLRTSIAGVVFPFVGKIFRAVAFLSVRVPSLRVGAAMAVLLLINVIRAQTLTLLGNFIPDVVMRTDTLFIGLIPLSRETTGLA